MAIPLQITWHGMEASPALEARIRAKATDLERFASDIMQARVTVEAPHRHHHQGKLFRVRVALHLRGHDIAATHQHPKDHAHEDAHVAVRDAFDAAIRQIEDHVRIRRRDVKNHAEPCIGRVTHFVAGEDYGFIETAGGQEVYFHRNSVAGKAFDRLRVGARVEVSVVDGEKGPQASLVSPLDEDRRSG